MAADTPDAPDHKASSTQPSDVLQALELYKQKDVTKGIAPFVVIILQLSELVSPVVVRFKAVGNAPIMKQNFYKITSSNRFQAVIQFLRKELGWAANEPLVRVQYISLISMSIFWSTSSPISISHSHPHLTTRLQTSTRYSIDPKWAASPC